MRTAGPGDSFTRRKALDGLRREEALARKLPLLVVPDAGSRPDPDGSLGDERLRLIFTCCHPALAFRLAWRSLGGWSAV